MNSTSFAVAAEPEEASEPALFLAVVFGAGLGVAAEFFGDVMLVAAKAGRVVADQQISNCIGGEDAGSEGFDYSLGGEGIEARGGVADREPIVTCDWVEETGVG